MMIIIFILKKRLAYRKPKEADSATVAHLVLHYVFLWFFDVFTLLFVFTYQYT